MDSPERPDFPVSTVRPGHQASRDMRTGEEATIWAVWAEAAHLQEATQEALEAKEVTAAHTTLRPHSLANPA